MEVIERIGHDYILTGIDCRTGRPFYFVRSDDNWATQRRFALAEHAYEHLAWRTQSRKEHAAHDKADKLLKGARKTLAWPDYLALYRQTVAELLESA